MTWPQIETLRDAGWEIAGHNLLHVNLSTLSDSLLNYQIATDFQNLTNHGCKPVSFALPNGNGGPREYDVISRYYKNIRNSNDAHMTYGWDRKRLGYFPAKTVLSADDLINRIKAGQRRREAIVIIGFHRFMDDPGDYTHNCPVDSLRKVLSYVKDNGFRVMTLREAAEEIGSP
jgi:peptidoglycan/xylan/chitin deacetylase (PgdA/CDA1 family)